MSVSDAFVLSDENQENPFILVSVRPTTNSDWWISELWTNNLRLGTASRMIAGGDCKIAPDRSKIAFWRRDGNGFHSLHVWDVKTDTIEDVISMWEIDPGSGTSWEWRWSADSKALNIQGACSGFHRYWKRGRKEFNLVYLVEAKRMFAIGQQP